MSEEETILQTEDGQTFTAEYRDGRFQIVDVAPFEKSVESHILPDTISDSNETKYIQVLDSSGKGLMQLDLLNFTLVKCDDNDEQSYQMVGPSSDDGGETLTCVLTNDDNEEPNQDGSSYVYLESVEENDTKPTKTDSNNCSKSQLSPTEILEKAKALQKTKALFNAQFAPKSTRGRKRKGSFPPPMELLSSPNFKLYLYSCKLCSYKCNAVKDMSAHKAKEHAPGSGSRSASTSGSSGSGSGQVRSRTANLQCAKCPFRAAVHSQLLKHVQEIHDAGKKEAVEEKPSGVVDVDLLVCGACGFESADRNTFREHIQQEHGVNVTLSTEILAVE